MIVKSVIWKSGYDSDMDRYYPCHLIDRCVKEIKDKLPMPVYYDWNRDKPPVGKLIDVYMENCNAIGIANVDGRKIKCTNGMGVGLSDCTYIENKELVTIPTDATIECVSCVHYPLDGYEYLSKEK